MFIKKDAYANLDQLARELGLRVGLIAATQRIEKSLGKSPDVRFQRLKRLYIESLDPTVTLPDEWIQKMQKHCQDLMAYTNP